jgi:hypothetical protein
VPRLLRLGVSAGKAMNLVLALVLEVTFKCIVKLYIFQFLHMGLVNDLGYYLQNYWVN